jgi:acetoin utilization protein AcuB
MVDEPSAAKDRAGAKVGDYMTPEPQTLGVGHSLLDAVLMIRRAGLRHIPIVDDGRLVGLISDRDLARFAPSMLIPLSPDEYNRVFESTEIGKVMAKNPLTTSPGALLAEAVDLISANRLGCLPVLENGTLVGILTKSDLMRALRDSLAAENSL